MEDWTIRVKDFGRIERAEVEVKPLTVFVGRNNSGKSYLASLIWGIESGLLFSLGKNPRIEKAMTSWIERARSTSEEWTIWSESERIAFQKAWPEFIEAHRPQLCKILFDANGIGPRYLSIGAPALESAWHIRLKPFGVDDLRVEFATTEHVHDDVSYITTNQKASPINLVLSEMAGYNASPPSLVVEYATKDAVFLPASRTGFSLFLPTIFQSTLGSLLTQQGKRPASTARFTLPQVHLLSALVSAFGGRPGPFADEAQQLERDCLEGTIVIQGETGVPRYAFRPTGTGSDLELHVSSALVTELMPLVVALRHAQHLPLLVLEEPEAHLHPRLVRAVIRCLCRLVRRGVRVLITTHSATVAQQVNNLVKLGSLETEARSSQQEHYGYSETEFLLPDEVSVHEFRFQDNGRTVVDRIEPSPFGFAMPTFNEPLQDFTGETLTLNALLGPENEE